MTFEPGEPEITRGNEINIFKGFPIPPKEGDVTPFKELVLHNVGGNAEYARVLTCFMAHILQKPWIKLRIAPFIMSKTEGVGKSLLIPLRKAPR